MLRIGFLVVVLVAVGIALWSNWEEVQGDLGRLGPVTILGAVVLSLLSPFFTVLGWRVLLADRGWTTQGPDDLWQHTTVEEIAEAVYWLVAEASFVTGHTLRVDGGRTVS